MVRGTEHGASEGMVPEGGLVDQVLGQHRRLVVRPGDLLDHHAALAVELVGVDSRTPDEVGEQVDGLRSGLRAGGDVEGHQVVALHILERLVAYGCELPHVLAA